MGAQGLLQKRGAGAREAEHEERLRDIGTSVGAGQGGEPFLDEEILEPRERAAARGGPDTLARDFAQPLPARIKGGKGFRESTKPIQ